MPEKENVNTEYASKNEEQEDQAIRETGSLKLTGKNGKHGIRLLTIIGEIEGHEAVSGNTKATKYEHLLPRLAEAEEDEDTEGVLILLNTLGGDVEAGLAIADDRLSEQTYGFTCAGRKPFYRRPSGCIGRLFIYCAYRNYDCSSGTFYRNVYRSHSELPKYGKDPGPDCQVYFRTFKDYAGASAGTDAGFYSACERCRNYAGGSGRGTGRTD